MNRMTVISLVLASLVLPVTSCTTGESQPSPAADGCEETLGTSGIKWVEDHAATDEGESVDRSGMKLKESRSEYLKQMDSWNPDGSHWSAELCSMSTFSSGKNKVFRLEFGPSSVPFDFDTKSDGGITTAVNDDVKLHQSKDARGVTRYGVYVKCQVSGNPARQASMTPLAGVLTDTLTSGTTPEDHVTYLLRSTKAVVKSLTCENKPVVPAGTRVSEH
ncbi:hypothetical protein ACIF8T_16035 [Streptomyces sp. NPDC085946]|uniref:hypothetical protein n=1 Tax=Streptomyces sp. NPDC085946 TaxID=3365744 RepID=UPI0037D7C7B4